MCPAPAGCGRPIVVMDRGWCGTCPAGGSLHPAGDALALTRELHPTGAPHLVAQPLPERSAVAPGPLTAAAPGLSRRALFARVQSAPAGSTPVAGEPPRPQKLPPAERLRQHAQLAAAGSPPPAGFFPSLRISERCQNHQVCAGVCPTGALTAAEDGETLGIAFDPLRCIACGQCEARCPEQAIRLGPAGDGALVRLSVHPARGCPDCGVTFAGTDGEVRCPPCRRSHDLALAGFALMRRPRADDAQPHLQVTPEEASA